MKSFKGISFAMISSGTFGLIGIFSYPIKLEGMDEYSILFYRFFFSALIIASICMIRKEKLNVPKEQISKLISLGVLYTATAFFFLFSFNYLPTGISTSMHFLYPVAVSMMMAFFFKEKKSIILFIATILSVFGVVMLCWTEGVVIRPIGVVIVLISVFSYTFYIIGVNKSEVGRLNAEVLTFYVMATGAVIFFFVALSTPKGLQVIPNTVTFVRLFALALVSTVISGFTLILAIKLVGSTITSILGSMEPLVALIVGVILLGEKFDLYSFFGIIAVLSSVMLVIIKGPKKVQEKELPPQNKIL